MTLARFRSLSDSVIEALAVLVALGLLTVVILGVVSRALNDPFVWTDELARYLMVWTALLGWSIAMRRRSHIRITLIIDRLPSAARRWLEAFIQICVLAFGLLLTRDGWTLVQRNWDIEATSMSWLSASFIYLPVIIGGLAVAAQAFGQAWEAIVERDSAPVDGGRLL